MLGGDIPQNGVRDSHDRGSRQRVEGRGRRRQDEGVEVGHVTGDVQAHRLPAAVGELREAADQPIHHQAGMIDDLTQADKVAMGLHNARLAREAQQRCAFLGTQRGAQLHPLDEQPQGLLSRTDLHGESLRRINLYQLHCWTQPSLT